MITIFMFLVVTIVDQNDRRKKILNNELWKFSFRDRQWTMVTTTPIFNDLTFSKFDFIYNEKFYFLKKGELFSFNFKNLSIDNYGKLNF